MSFAKKQPPSAKKTKEGERERESAEKINPLPRQTFPFARFGTMGRVGLQVAMKTHTNLYADVYTETYAYIHIFCLMRTALITACLPGISNSGPKGKKHAEGKDVDITRAKAQQTRSIYICI